MENISNIRLPYDKTSAKSIEKYAKRLINHTFEDVLFWKYKESDELAQKILYYSNRSNKGALGMLLEQEFFMYDTNSNPIADFQEAGVELKLTPYQKNSNGKLFGFHNGNQEKRINGHMNVTSHILEILIKTLGLIFLK